MRWIHPLLIGIALSPAAPLQAAPQSADVAAAPAEASQTLTLQVVQAILNTEDPDNAVLDIQLAPDSTHAFARFTEDHVGKRMALLADGRVLTSPVIMGPITEGRLRITPGVGDYAIAPEEFRAIADKLATRQAVIQARLLPAGQ
jgi:preprotein translocase subunit SecD